jgi:hypothetical protein
MEQELREAVVDKAVYNIDNIIENQQRNGDIERELWEALSVSTDIDVKSTGTQIDYHSIFGDEFGGSSVKPTNIELNVIELGKGAANAGLAMAAANSNPLLLPASILVVIGILKSQATVELERNEVLVYYTICRQGHGSWVSKEEVDSELDSVIEELELEVSTETTSVNHAIRRLSDIGAIETRDYSDGQEVKALEKCFIEL